jgi:hypothetical protein
MSTQFIQDIMLFLFIKYNIKLKELMKVRNLFETFYIKSNFPTISMSKQFGKNAAARVGEKILV